MEKLVISDLLKFKFISNLSFSPDGKLLGFVVHRMNEDDNSYESKIWVYNTENKKMFQLTSFGMEKSFIFPLHSFFKNFSINFFIFGWIF